jgi:sortase B
MDAISGGAARDGFTAGASIGTGGAAEIGCVPYAGLHTMTYHAHSQPDVTQALTYTMNKEGSDAILPLLYNIQAYNPDFAPAQFEGFWYDIADDEGTDDVMPDDGAPDDTASLNSENDSVPYAAGIAFPDTNVSHVYAQAVQELSQEEQQALAYLNQPYNEYVEMVRSLQQDNGDVKGWIRVEGTVINYPLLQGEDNDFYAKHNYEKREITYGSIYMNSRSNLKDNTSNIIIYGHNMKDNQMFGSLSWYSDPSYYNAHPIVHIATDETESAYQIICAFRSRVYPVDFDPAVFRYYRHVSFPDAQTFSDYLQNCKNLQLYETGITAEYGDQLILLSTCEYTQVNGRFVVLAKKLPAGAAL